MKLYFIRHTSVDVPKGVCYGQSNVPLKPTFEAEAEIVKNQLDDLEFDAVFSSPLSRCRKLARYCGFEDRVQWVDRIKEIYFGDWEMQAWDDIKDDNLTLWYDDWVNRPATGGESLKMVYERVASFLDEVKTENYRNVAIFAHGGVINCAKVYAGLTTLENVFDTVPAYGEIVCLDI